MRKKMFSFKNFVMLFMAIGLLTSIGCSKQDNSNAEVEKLQKEVSTLKADLAKEFNKKMNDEIAKLKKEISDLEAAGKGKADAKDLESKYVSLAVFEGFKKDVGDQIKAADTSKELGEIETNVNSFEGRLKALETLLEIKEGKSPYDFKDLKTKVEANETAIKNLTEKGIDKEAFKKEFDALMEKMGVDIPALSGRITSLVLLPEYVSDKGGALPVIFFRPLSTPCGSIAPAVEVQYVVNPSTVTAADIDTENLTFRYNDPKVAARPTKNPKTTAKFVSLVDGILTVSVTVDIDQTWAATNNNTNPTRIDQLMLQVSSKDHKAVVNSDWAKIMYAPKSAEIVRKPMSGNANRNYVLASTLQAAKGLSVTSTTVVEMAYDAEVDMNEVVESVYDTTFESFDPSTYGLEFSYDLKDESGDPIVYNEGTNNTNQQEFVKLNGSVVSTKVYGKDANQAAIGRKPIVHVMLKKGDCIVKQGFVKFNVVEKAIPAVEPIVFKADGGTYSAACGATQTVVTVDTKQMNEEFYHAVNMSKTDFHKNYKLQVLEGGVGTVTQITDANDNTSYNLVYTLTEQEVWDNVGQTVWKKAKYVYGTSVIEMTFKATIAKETVKLDLLLDNYWFNGFTNTIQNVAIPDKDATDATKATYANNINNSFVTVEGQNVLNLNNGVTPANKYANYTYEYIFDKTSNQPIKKVEGHKDGLIKIIVSTDGKQLKATQGSKTEVVATIKTQSADGDILEYNADSELGKWLLNKGPEFMKARVVLVVKNSCSKPVNVEVKNLPAKDRFNIHFLRPINVEPKSAKNFVDGVDFGANGSYIDIKEVAKLSDWRNRTKETDKYDFLPDNANYYQYYGVVSITVDTDAIKVKEGLTVGGKQTSTLPSTIEVKQTEPNESFDGVTYEYGRLTYRNNGNNLDKPFTLTVPVTIEYKWGKVTTNVDVVVKSTRTTARKAAK